MQQGKDLQANPARLINSSQKIRTAASSKQQNPQGAITPKMIADLFGTMIGLFGGRWVKEHGTADRTGAWLDTLKGINPKLLALGIKRCQQEKDWPPSAPEFLKLCQPKPEDLGLPPMAKAWLEANDGARSPNSYPWSHRAVYLAGKAVGWYELRAQLTAQEQRDVKVKFANAYQLLVNKAVNGEPLEDHLAIEHQFDPSIGSNKLQREIMEDQGIDPMDGVSARARLKGMSFHG